MKLTSKFDKGANVWFLNNIVDGNQSYKFMEGTILEIQSWDKWSGFRYDISHIDTNGNEMIYNIMEKDIYKSKNEVLNSAFEENGTIPEPEVVEEEQVEEPKETVETPTEAPAN